MKKNIIGIILARKNSKRIKNKNLVILNNKAMIRYSIESLKESKLLKNIFVSSDCREIKKISKKYNVNFIDRPKNLCKDNSTSEKALEHSISLIQKKISIDTVVFLQPTSPYRPSGVIDRALKRFYLKKADSLFSSSNFVNHIWERKNNKLKPINYNFKKRKMDQAKKSQINENGSFYIFDSKKFMIYKNRLFGKILDFEIETKYSYQVDEKEDVLILNSLLKKSKLL